jgi:Ca-activated chloride channel family protein
LSDISGNRSTEELDNYYNGILSVFQQNYEGPEDLIQELKFQSIGSPGIDDPRMQFKENLNVMVILDASGSMGKDMNGQTQMETAKSAITNFVKGLPENANVGLRIYGQEGSGKADKELSCKSSELFTQSATMKRMGLNKL